MLQIRMMTIEDTERAKPMFREAPRLFDKQKLILNQTFVVDDSGMIMGLASYKLKDAETAIIDCFYIKKSERRTKLGDGLLRALLNHMNLKKVTTVFINSGKETNGFFVAEGLEIAAVDPQNADLLTFRVTLPNFFDKGCKHERLKA